MTRFETLKSEFETEGLEGAISWLRDQEFDGVYDVIGALVQSGPVINAYPEEFETQLVGRLFGHASEDVSKLVEEASAIPKIVPVCRTFFEDNDDYILHTWVAHSDFVGGLQLLPDGDTLVSTSEDGEVRYFSVKEKRFLRSEESRHGGSAVNHVAISPSGKIATSGDDYAVRITENGDEVASFSHGNYASRVGWLDDDFLVSVSKDQRVRVWNVSEGTMHADFDDHGGWVYVLAVNHAGDRFVTSSVNNKLILWGDGLIKTVVGEGAGDVHYVMGDLYLGGKNSSGIGHEDAPNAFVWSSDDSTFVSAANDIVVWDSKDDAFTEKCRLAGDPWGIKSLLLTSNDKRLISFGKSIKIWDLETEREVISIGSPEGKEIRSAVWIERDKLFAAGDAKGNIWLIDFEQLQESASRPKHNGLVYPLKFSADGTFVMSGGSDGSSLVFRTDTGQHVSKLSGFSRMFVNAVGFRNNAQEAIACADGEMVRFDTATGTETQRITGPDSIYSFTWQSVSPDEKFAIGGAPIAPSSRWDFETGEVRSFEEKFAQPGQAVWVDGGKEIVMTAYDEEQSKSNADGCPATRWDTETLKKLSEYHPIGGKNEKGYFEYISSVAVNHDRTIVFGLSSHGKSYAWEFDSATRIFSDQTFGEYGSVVSYLGGDQFASVCDTKEIAIFDIARKTEIVRHELDTDILRNPTLSDDGKWICAAISDHTIGVIDLETGEILATVSDSRKLWRGQLSPDKQILVVGTQDGHVLPFKLRIS